MPSNTAEDKTYYKTLTRKIFTTVVVVSFMPLIFVSGIILYHFQTAHSSKVCSYLEALVNRHRHDIDMFLTERENNIHFLAESYNYPELSDEDFLQKKLEILRKEYGEVFSDLGVVDHNGHQTAYAGPFRLENANYASAEWFQKAMREQFFISDVFMGLRGFPHFIVAARNEWNGNHYILRATVDFQAFNRVVRNIRIGETGSAFIINRKNELQTDTSLDISEDSELYRGLINQAFDAQSKVRISVLESRKTQKRNLYVTGLLNNGHWALIYQQDVGDAFAEIYRTWWIALIVFTAGAVAIITMAMIVSRRTVGRIAEADNEKEMMNQQVIESNRLASLGEMAAGIAHEINNPVAIMVEEAGWISDLLEEEEFQESENLEEFQTSLGQIKKQGLRCRDITHKLLSFARRSESQKQIIKINAMVEEVVGLFSHQAKYSNVRIVTKFAEDMPYIHASQTELQQVLFNLINNALDALRATGGKIVIMTGCEDDMAVIEVKDNGPGIPRADLAKIFDPFYTTKPVGKGTGLGLSICYGILNNMGGKITVASSVGIGTNFRVFIPHQDSGPGTVSEASSAIGKAVTLTH
ncbi:MULTISPECIES: sensor histidine kinase [Desulfococcus]|uniref:histidine kinase n=1 Tax=Desulfococcus multivorans DSM 2059 TaxID=1121405 RepID=S7TZP0_DESML|nr:ATP-binding protein [Desulfococcus multivorans]AOY58368.1 two component system sensor histidine kinase [Desulfococcus multivorans]AQV00699.1 two-component sensor histidine kinase [Desulfococcus multivorans]EPR42557.1 integral membrane sensor signal transduction histidine kinase [Desulfococcus multivorans DSM 2059]SKA18770.1 two-component system, NtrC family, sensor kinase [Desulfococcus multivorans DSM 2059]